LFIIYFILKKYATRYEFISERLIDATLFTFILVTIINTTGGLSSPLFFLNFFLLFALALLLEPIISITTTLSLIVFYLLSIPENQPLEKLLPLFSLPFLTPFALFLGEEQRKIANYKLQIDKDHDEIGKTKEKNLLFLSLVVKQHLAEIKEAADNFVGDRELNRIKAMTKRAQKMIEEYEKES
ncbi:MAG TPA: hypothetical protein VK338_04630, partial [Candidatus Nitrosocosmicus sp.]|nr:hypothetical protein [Candidatus Nitrosocosmicus sp.]